MILKNRIYYTLIALIGFILGFIFGFSLNAPARACCSRGVPLATITTDPLGKQSQFSHINGNMLWSPGVFSGRPQEPQAPQQDKVRPTKKGGNYEYVPINLSYAEVSLH